MENEAIFHMTRGACVGGLSDFFCIAVDLCVHAPDLDIGLDLDNASAGEGVIEGADEGGVEPCLQSVHFLTSRVTCAKAYALHLLLLLCGPEKVQTLLTPPEPWFCLSMTVLRRARRAAGLPLPLGKGEPEQVRTRTKQGTPVAVGISSQTKPTTTTRTKTLSMAARCCNCGSAGVVGLPR